MRTNYIGHDAQYKRRRAGGFAGWETASAVTKNLNHFAAALSAAHVPQSGRLLELGCGAGDISLWLAEKGYEVSGVDISPFAIAWADEKAQERNLQVQFSVGDVRDLATFADASYDLVIDGRCLHCIIGEDRDLFLSSARRVLRPGGFVHINTMCNEPKTPGLMQNFDPVTRCQVYGDTAVRFCGFATDIVAEVDSSGFDLLGWKVVVSTSGGEDLLLIDAVKPLSA